MRYGTALRLPITGTGSSVRRLGRMAASLLVAGFAGTVVQLWTPSHASAEGWVALSSGTLNDLYDISCSSTTACVAAGDSGIILTTADGGSTWTSRPSGVIVTLSAVNCPSSTICYAGGSGTIIKSTNGGQTWASQNPGISQYVYDISCPTTTTCFASGGNGALLATTNGGSTWSNQGASSAFPIFSLSCPTTTTCFAVTYDGWLMSTTNGGSTWASKSIASGQLLSAISCPSVSVCTAGGTGILRSADGGATWGAQSSGSSRYYYDLACPTTLRCFAAQGEVSDGGPGEIRTTTNGGSTWTAHPIGSASDIEGLSCPMDSTCFAAGDAGRLLVFDSIAPGAPTIGAKPANPSGSASASFGFSGEAGGSFECKLDGGAFVACSSPKSYSGLSEGSHTFQVRQIDAAGNVGAAASYTWVVDVTAPGAPTITQKPEPVSTSSQAEFSFAGEPGGGFRCQLDTQGYTPCESPQEYVDLSDGKHTFEVHQVDAAGNVGAAASYMWVVAAASGDLIDRGAAASDSCSDDATVADGFGGGTYVKLRAEQVDPDTTWICLRATGASQNFGGRVEITGAAAGQLPTHDEDSPACVENAEDNAVPGNHPVRSGTVGPNQTPFMVDVLAMRDGSAAWLCVQVGNVHKRLIVPLEGPTPPTVRIFSDAPPVPNPAPEHPPAGYPSGGCQDGAGGEHASFMNAELVSGAHVWLESWRSSERRALMCVRFESPFETFGGALLVDATGSPGLTPVITPGDHMTPCPRNVFRSDQNDVEIKRSDVGVTPASLCVRKGETTVSLSANVIGSATPPTVAFTDDPDNPDLTP